MKRLLTFVLLALLGLQAYSQTLTEAEVCETMNHAFVLNKEKKYKEALEAFLVVGDNTKGQRTEAERQTYVCSQIMACHCYELTGGYKEGYQLAKQLMGGNTKPDERRDIAHVYVLNGYLYACQFLRYNDNFNPQKARTLLEEILPYADEENEELIRSKVRSRIPYAWYMEGVLAQIGQHYDKALPCMEKAVDGYRQLGDVKDETSAVCNMATMYYHLCDINKALDAYRYAQSLAQQSEDNAKLMEILIEKERLNDILGDIAEKMRIGQAIDSLIGTDNSPKLLYLYNNFKGDEAKSQGNLDLALLWYKKNDEYVSRMSGKLTSDRHGYYVKLRDLCSELKRYDEALGYARLCVKEEQSVSKSTDRSYLSYMSIARIYQHIGDKENCEKALDTLFMAASRMTDPREKLMLYETRGACRTYFKDYDKALSDYKTADTLLATKYGEEDGDRVELLALKGGVEHQLKHYAESERLYAQYAERIGKLYGRKSDEYIQAVTYLANAEAFAGHIDDGCKHYSEAVEMLKDKVRSQLPYMTTAERDGYWQSVSSLLTKMSPFAIEAKHMQTEFTRSCYDALIMSKAFLLESDRSTYETIKRYGNEKDLQDFTKMQSLQLKIKGWEKYASQYADSVTTTSARINAISRVLAARCRSYDDITSFLDVDYESVRKSLGNDDLLIDFTDYVSESMGRKYAAFIISKSQDYPLLKYLFAERSIDSLGMFRPDYFYEEPYATTICDLLWKPLAEHAKEGATIYYVPSQLLFRVSLEAIPLEDGSLLGDHYHFVRLSSARELVRYRGQLDMKGNASAILYGGLKYDVGADVMAATSRKYEISPMFAMRGGMLRGDSVFRELPGTLKEVEAVTEILRKNKVKATTYKGVDGTAESFVYMSGKAPKMLLVSTHGFYYTPTEAERYEYLKGYRDAMSLSGLVFAGGNAAWLGKDIPKGVMSGILTANDIATLDLSGLDMVVLSACQTGQGAATAEGLYGLQRAFKKAGARTMVMTLWSVNDQVTCDFMVKFHELLAANGWNKRKAFEDAKAAIRERYPEPFYWAGFVMLD